MTKTALVGMSIFMAFIFFVVVFFGVQAYNGIPKKITPVEGHAVFKLKALSVSEVPYPGSDIRVYEFVPPNTPDVMCVYVLTRNNGALDCVSKQP